MIIETKDNVRVHLFDGIFYVIVSGTPALASQYNIKLKETFFTREEAITSAASKRKILKQSSNSLR